MPYPDRSNHFLSPGKSNFLNFVRWAAALLVVLGHSDMYLQKFGGKLEQWDSFGYFGAHSHASVMVFFVLSGYVVAYATGKKSEVENYNFREYFLDRWSRIYSVLLISIAFTLLIDFIGRGLSPIYFNPDFIPQDGWALRLLMNVFALQGVQGYRVQLGSNPALWSIGYEFCFYLLYGLLFFRKKLFRRQWVLPLIFVAVTIAIGWKMVLYFGVWLLGVLAYRLSRSNALELLKISNFLLVILLVGANHFINFANIFHLPEIFQDIFFAVVIATLLVVDVPASKAGLSTQINTYLADFSYSLYAFHMPVIFFLCCLLFLDFFQHISRIWPGVILVLASVVVGRIFFKLGEARRASYRRIADLALMRFGL
jgi:peptidoglycan/LPS O-acetylase OafA/YrhL